MIVQILLAVVAVGAIIFSLWWLLIETEGVYLGRRVVILLYDLYARRYDGVKDILPEYEQALLVEPLMGIIAPHSAPLVLDVATGTGRLPAALMQSPFFQGRVIGVDLSERMLRQAAPKFVDESRVTLMACPAEDLPFPDDTFDVVTCLEALEFMADTEAVIAEVVRVLRPGGLLLTTNRINTRWMPGKTFENEALEQMLYDHGIENVVIEPWQMDYHRVWALKEGDSLPTGPKLPQEVTMCPHCGGAYDFDWECTACGRSGPVIAESTLAEGVMHDAVSF